MPPQPPQSHFLLPPIISSQPTSPNPTSALPLPASPRLALPTQHDKAKTASGGRDVMASPPQTQPPQLTNSTQLLSTSTADNRTYQPNRSHISVPDDPPSRNPRKWWRGGGNRRSSAAQHGTSAHFAGSHGRLVGYGRVYMGIVPVPCTDGGARGGGILQVGERERLPHVEGTGCRGMEGVETAYAL